MPSGSVYTYIGNADPKNNTAAIETSQGTVVLGGYGYFLPSEYQSAISQGLLLTPGQSGTAPSPRTAAAYVGTDANVGGPGGSPIEPSLLYTPSLLHAAEVRGLHEALRAQAKHNVEYQDATQLLEQWASLGNWTTFGTPAPTTNSGKLIGTGVLASQLAGLYRPFVLGASGRGRALFPVSLPAGAGSAGAYLGVGLVSDTGSPAITSAVLANGPTWIFNLNAGTLLLNDRGTVTNSNQYATISLPDGGYIASEGTGFASTGTVTLTSAQTAYIDVEVDEEWVTITLMPAGHAWEIRTQLPRTAFGSGSSGIINEIVLFNLDSRGASGAQVGASVIKNSLSSYNPRATAVTAGAEAVSDRVIWTRAGGTDALGDAIRVWIPPTYDSRVPTPTVLYSHSYGASETEPYDNTGMSPAFAALVAAGFIICSVDDEGQDWGNAAAQGNLLAAYEYVRDRLNIGAIIAAGSSMGGVATANLVAARTVPNIVGMLLWSPLLNQSWFYSQLATGGQYASYASSFESAFGLVSTSDPNYSTNVPQYDPMAQAGNAFRGIRTRIYYSPNDGLVLPANNESLFLSLIGPYTPEASSYAGTGGHLDPSQYSNTSDIVAFANRCILS